MKIFSKLISNIRNSYICIRTFKGKAYELDVVKLLNHEKNIIKSRCSGVFVSRDTFVEKKMNLNTRIISTLNFIFLKEKFFVLEVLNNCAHTKVQTKPCFLSWDLSLSWMFFTNSHQVFIAFDISPNLFLMSIHAKDWRCFIMIVMSKGLIPASKKNIKVVDQTHSYFWMASILWISVVNWIPHNSAVW